MGRILYLECESGISGDMVVGALLDAGASERRLREALASLPVDGYEIRVTRKKVSSVDCCDFDVVLDEAHHNHDHDMDYLFGRLDEPARAHAHDGHAHHHEHHHEHRHLADVERIIDAGKLTPRARDLGRRIFRIVAEAEAKAHGVPVGEVHFHEVGAVDSIVDVVSAAVCLDDLDVTDAVVGPLAEGHGRVRTQHGVLPVPVPAVVNIATQQGLVLAPRDSEGEFVTPTGAAIAAAIRTLEELPDAYRVIATGTGSGKRAYEPVSTVRAMLIEPACSEQHSSMASGASSTGKIWKLETEVDDCTGEALGHALERLLEAGVNEAHYLPVYMKKNRPAYQVEVLCREGDIPQVERILFEETSTIGIRRYPVERTTLERREVTVETPLGPAAVKVVTLPDGSERAYPEYEAVAGLARRAGIPFQDAYRAVLRG